MNEDIKNQNNAPLAVNLQRWVSCCLTCLYWDGDRALQLKNIKESGDIVMDKFKGWPEEGCCKIDYEWSSLEINGDATATFRVSSNFGCNYHSKPQNN